MNIFAKNILRIIRKQSCWIHLYYFLFFFLICWKSFELFIYIELMDTAFTHLQSLQQDQGGYNSVPPTGLEPQVWPAGTEC